MTGIRLTSLITWDSALYLFVAFASILTLIYFLEFHSLMVDNPLEIRHF